ncbi:c-type cytochrome [Ferrovum sp. PN-J185]|uniref:c-type cytochrome n=1 Tax=Ferrovum sp. PN-J185 TaxID=1356306 RepID=UPI000793661A|nr:c-type cytochrome [Ferrovum sp. PN-J185]KXW55938.1 cytochrome c-555 precursor [Ferrovum sp. PN-J185]MCC6068674.1 c-type cytochrome [Ferrovum sp. PN-J185]MDE1891923.1 cytochrome c5 family protein [Betaproteobacteria bacterium]MDE2056996.1 cytochrome c5 family protein [Betaproteobacteria bacterium]
MSNTNSSFLNVVKGILLTAAGVVVVLFLQHFVFSLKPQPHISNTEIEKRIKPLASVVITPLPKQATAASEPANSSQNKTVDTASTSSVTKESVASNDNTLVGKKTFDAICTGCHSSGALGAPKFGNKKDWAPRIAQGIDILYHSAINGKNSMPAKGGNPSLTDAEVKAAVDYMVAAAK